MQRGNKQLGSLNNEVMHTRQIIVFIVIIIILAIWLFFHFYWDNPSKVFNRMLNNTLTTSNYTKTVTDYENKQYSTQIITVETGAVNRVLMNQTLTIPSYPKGIVKISSIGTPTSDYSSYTALVTPARDANGRIVNYKSIIGLWGVNTPQSKVTEGNLFNGTVLDIVPMANINPTTRKQLHEYIIKNKVYTFSGAVKSQSNNGRLMLIYNVNVNMHYYQNYINLFGAAIGLNQFNPKTVNVSNLPTNSYSHYQFGIDALTGQLITLKYNHTNLAYKFSSYGAAPTINLPKNTIQLAKLENLIQLLNQK